MQRAKTHSDQTAQSPQVGAGAVIGLERVGATETAWGLALRLARRAAKTPAPVLLLGETGTGKEVVADLLHAESKRRGAMVAVNCGSIPAAQVEFELFGHARGAYTGVTSEGKGYVREADGGTLFLDEIGELPLAAQTKLLRVLQQRTVRPMGGKGEIPVDFRLVCATHCDLEAMVREGRFREDLYNRIAVVDIRLPPLRERPAEDVIALARYFVREDGPAYGCPKATLTPDAETYLSGEWRKTAPGNVRGLRRLIWRALVRCTKGEIKRADLTADVAPAIDVVVDEVERARAQARAERLGRQVPHADVIHEHVRSLWVQHVESAPTGTEWSVSRLAREVGIARRTVGDMIARWRRHPVATPSPVPNTPEPE